MIIAEAKKVIRIEAEALSRLADSIDGEFERAVSLILQSKGRVVVSGMGKSGHIARKIASTLSTWNRSPAPGALPPHDGHGGADNHEREQSSNVDHFPDVINRGYAAIGAAFGIVVDP